MEYKQICLLEAVTKKMRGLTPGKVLDLGCGPGDYSKSLKDLGFDVTAGDINPEIFKYQNEITFKSCDITREILFGDQTFDYVLLLEVIEHLRNPYDVIPRINRILKNGGSLIISTPNILSLKSRLRFMFEGCYEYFREPPLEQSKNLKEVIFNLHLIPYRYQELEFLLSDCGFKVESIFTSKLEGYGLSFLVPFLRLQAWLRERRVLRKGGLDYRRIHEIMLSKELLFGRHLIVQARKEG